MKINPADSNNDSDSRAPAWLTIDLAALAANYNFFRQQTGGDCQVAGVIKANGYGLGVDKVLAALENQDCPFYYVATPDEALHLRQMTQKPVAVFGGPYPGAEDLYIHENIIPVLNSLADIERWQQQARQHDIALPAIIHFDTAINRLGLGADETQLLAQAPEKLEGLNISYVMSHFASADEAGNKTTARQYEQFLKAAAIIPAAKKSLCNSAGIMRDPAYHLDQVRPGVALYGVNPVPEKDNPMQKVVSLHARILQIRNAQKGDTVGYGETYRFEKETALATVALGYGDGFLRCLGNRGRLYYDGTPCPIVGRVSMDATIVDIGHLNPLPRPGDAMEVIGPHQDIDMLANDAGTIGYEILTALGRRYHRKYI